MSKTITAGMIKELRDRTGVGMGKCKEALEKADCDMELAINNLRKDGIASAVKKEGRTANEGMIGIAEDDKAIAIVEVNAETDFVVKNDLFKKFLNEIAEEVVHTAPHSLEDFKAQKFSKDKSLTVEEYRATIVQAIGENIQIKRFKIFPKTADKSIGIYSHMGGKIVTVVEITGSSSEVALAKDIAMHTAAAAPEYLSPAEVPASVLENEKDVARGQMQGKPANMIEKIVEGKVNSYYDAACLLRQKFIKNDQLTITELVNQAAKATGKPLKVTAFVRWTVGQ